MASLAEHAMLGATLPANGEDMSTRMPALHQIPQQDELLDFLLESVEDGVLIYRDGDIFRFNALACRTLGYSEDELPRLTVLDIIPQASPESIAKIDRKLAECGGMVTGEGQTRTKDDRIVPVEFRIAEKYLNGKRFVVATFRDISVKKRLEAELIGRERELRDLAENSPDVIIRYDRDGKINYCNRVPLGCDLGCLLCNRCRITETALVEKDAAGAEQTLADIVRNVLKTGDCGETDLTWNKEGVITCLQVRVVPELDPQGQVASALAVARDITRLKQMEIHMRQSRDTLRALAAHLEAQREDERRSVTRQVHEDLAQNLVVLRMYISMMRTSCLATSDATLVAAAQGIADQCIVRSRDMVTMLRPTVLDMGIVPALRWLAADFREGCGLAVQLRLPEEIHLDDDSATFIFRAAQEALINTMLHAAATEARIVLDADDEWCRLTVRDNGQGFDPEPQAGDGCFGLIRMRQQTQHLGGELFIISRPHQGTTLKVQIPTRSGLPRVSADDTHLPDGPDHQSR